MIERKGLIIYFKEQSVLNKLDKSVVRVYYVSEKEKYAIVYCDANRYKPLCSQLSQLEGIVSFEDANNDVESNSF